MKAVILAGGLGTRIGEESHLRPKPMIEIGGKPLLWHIFKSFSTYGVNEFIVCCGYRGYMIKEYFANYFLHMSDISIDMSTNSLTVLQKHVEPWKVTLVDTGEKTQTGGRIKQVGKYLNDTFFLTYGDGLSDVNLTKLLEFHRKSRTLATVTGVQPAGRFGNLKIKNSKVEVFDEKPSGDGQWVSGGFYVCEPDILSRIASNQDVWENEPMSKLVKEKQLSVYKHTGFWTALDTLRDKIYIEKLWDTGDAPWKTW